MSESTYWCVYQPNGHCVWETLHFDEKLTWRQMYRHGYRCQRVTIRKVRS
jgi:hypothetical protein